MDDTFENKFTSEFLHFLAPLLLEQNAKIYSLIYKGKEAENNLFNFALKSKDMKVLTELLSRKNSTELFNLLFEGVVLEDIFLVKTILQAVKYEIDNHLPLHMAILLKNRKMVEYLLICGEPKSLNKELILHNEEFKGLLPLTALQEEFCSFM